MSTDRIQGVYALFNRDTGQSYIGSSVSIKARWAWHRRHLRRGAHVNNKLQRAWQKYGEEAFEFRVMILVHDQSRLIEIEQSYIDAEEDPYNLIPAGYVPSFKGHTHTEQAKQLLRVAHLGKKRSDEARKNIGDASRGRVMPREAVDRIAALNRGRRHTPETIEKMQKAWTPERRASHSAKIRKITPEMVKQIILRYPQESFREIGNDLGFTPLSIRTAYRKYVKV